MQAASVERVCFPPNEACTEEMMKQRALKIRELFLWRLTEKAVKWQVFEWSGNGRGLFER